MEKSTPVVAVSGYDIVKSYRNGILQATPVTIVGGGVTSAPSDEIVATYADLLSLPQTDGTIVFVLSDENNNGNESIYKLTGGTPTLLTTKPTPYTISEIDAMLLNKVDNTIYQTDKAALIDDIDNLIIDVASLDDLKADKMTTYTKTEIDDSQLLQNNRIEEVNDSRLTATNNLQNNKLDKDDYEADKLIQDDRLNKLEETKFLEVSSADNFTGTVPTTLTLLNLQNGINSIGGIVMGADGGVTFPANGTYDIRIRYNVVNSTSTNKTLITGVGTTNLPASIIKNRTETQVAPFNSGIAQTQTLNIKVIITNFATEKRYVFVNSSGSGTMNYVNNTVNSPISIVVTK